MTDVHNTFNLWTDKGLDTMNDLASHHNVINLAKKRLEQKTGRIRLGGRNQTRVIAIASGKGGVGKTNIVANLGYSLGRLGKRVLIWDADLGLGNLDVLLGLTPRYNFSHVMAGEKALADIIIDGPGNMKILPAASGIQELTRLSPAQKVYILNEIDSLFEPVDILLIDTAAGISSNVMYFATTAQEIVIVVCPEPTSITDAYALMKVLHLKYAETTFKLLVNSVSSASEAKEVYGKLRMVADQFLDINIEYVGCVLFDRRVTQSVLHQKVVSEMYPNALASHCFATLAAEF